MSLASFNSLAADKTCERTLYFFDLPLRVKNVRPLLRELADEKDLQDIGMVGGDVKAEDKTDERRA
jgi:hypothetical protein